MTVELHPSSATPQDRLPLAWQVAPETIAFILDIEAASRNARDLVDGLIFAAIQSANVSAISNDPELQLAYAALPDAPPEDLRRPVSISAIANSLRMPFETARRRIQALATLGALQVTSRGVLIAQGVLGNLAFLKPVVQRHEVLQAFYLNMKVRGVPALPMTAPASAPLPLHTSPPIRLTNRLIWEYILRVADDLGAAVGSTTSGVILLAMIHENTEGFSPAERIAWSRAPRRFAKPVRNGRLATRLNFSSETLRRHVIALEARGFCARDPGGLIALAPPDARPALDRLALDNLVHLQRLFARLRQFGVLALWDEPELTASAAGA